MTQVTQLTAGTKPAAYLLIGDKVELVIPEDRGMARITGLTSKGPGDYYVITDKTITSGAGAVRDDTQITGLVAGAKPATVYVIGDKTETLIFDKPVSDTYLVYMSLSNLDTILPETTDTYLPVLTLSATATASYVSTDTYLPRLTLTAQPPIVSGATPQFGTDTYMPVLTSSYALLAGELIEGSDTYVPIISESSDVVTADQVNATDTYIPVIYWGWTRTVSTDEFLVGSDSYVPVMTLTGTATTVTRDVDKIVGSLKPFGVISGRWI